MNSKETNDSSANAQSNGWTFQYVAALVIFLEHMQQAKCFCVEGTDDIVSSIFDDELGYDYDNKIILQNGIFSD